MTQAERGQVLGDDGGSTGTEVCLILDLFPVLECSVLLCKALPVRQVSSGICESVRARGPLVSQGEICYRGPRVIPKPVAHSRLQPWNEAQRGLGGLPARTVSVPLPLRRPDRWALGRMMVPRVPGVACWCCWKCHSQELRRGPGPHLMENNSAASAEPAPELGASHTGACWTLRQCL